jgi:hypothetical protein
MEGIVNNIVARSHNDLHDSRETIIWTSNINMCSSSAKIVTTNFFLDISARDQMVGLPSENISPFSSRDLLLIRKLSSLSVFWWDDFGNAALRLMAWWLPFPFVLVSQLKIGAKVLQ